MFSLPYIFQSFPSSLTCPIFPPAGFPSSAYSCLISTYFVLDVQCRGMLCKQFDWNIYGSYVRCINFYYFLLYGAGISYETIYCNYLGNLHPCFDIPHTHLAVIELFSSVCYLKLFFYFLFTQLNGYRCWQLVWNDPVSICNVVEI